MLAKRKMLPISKRQIGESEDFLFGEAGEAFHCWLCPFTLAIRLELFRNMAQPRFRMTLQLLV